MNLTFLQRSLSDPHTFGKCDAVHATHFYENDGPIQPIEELDDGLTDNADLVANVPPTETPLPLPTLNLGEGEEDATADDDILPLPKLTFNRPEKKPEKAAGNEADSEREFLPLPAMQF